MVAAREGHVRRTRLYTVGVASSLVDEILLPATM
jgi:hypothetical protein